MHEVLVNRLGGLSLPRKSVVRLTDRPDMTLDVNRGRKTTMQQNTYEGHIRNKYKCKFKCLIIVCDERNSKYVIHDNTSLYVIRVLLQILETVHFH